MIVKINTNKMCKDDGAIEKKPISFSQNYFYVIFDREKQVYRACKKSMTNVLCRKGFYRNSFN